MRAAREIRTKAHVAALLDEVLELLREIKVTIGNNYYRGTAWLVDLLVRAGKTPGADRSAVTLSDRLSAHGVHCHRLRLVLPPAKVQRAYLTAPVGLEYWSRRIENFAKLQKEVYAALDEVVRASSAVECFNSLLRPYISVKKHLSPGFLALIALYWNTHPLAQRGNQTLLELAGADLGDDDWVRLLEHEMRYEQATQAPTAGH